MQASPTASDWHAVGPLEELERGSLTPFKHGRQQVVVVRRADGELFALDNRCPHEGYPLAQGTLKGDALTCCWHNWKFDVRDGRCTLGGEGARTFPVRIVDGTVEVDLSEPDPSSFFPDWKRSLYEGIGRHDNGRALRDATRLLHGGYDPVELLLDVAAFDARHAEYGTTHTLAVCADAARLLDRHPGAQAVYAVAPAIDMCGEANRRLPERRTPPPLPGADESSLRAAVEAEEAERAEGLLRGALADGLPRATIERWLFAVLSDHFLDFGHPLIYLIKGQELLDRTDGSRAAEVWPALLHSIVLGTREDTLPYMEGFARRLGEVEAELPRVHGAARQGTPFDFAAVRDAALDGTRDEAFDAVWGACEAGVPGTAVAGALVAAAAHRLLRFDPAIDADPLVAENWIWATHRLTFASAVRNACERFDSPDALRFLFQTLAFTHTGRRMDLPPDRRERPEQRSSSPAGLVRAIQARDAGAALGGALSLLRGGKTDDLRVALEDLCLADPLVRPIAVAHALKTTVAAFEESAALAATPDGETPVLAAVRFLASPLVERRVHEQVGTSLRWITQGEMPRKLTQ